jgi:tetratricopeptide (TPR) repeat protein
MGDKRLSSIFVNKPTPMKHFIITLFLAITIVFGLGAAPSVLSQIASLLDTGDVEGAIALCNQIPDPGADIQILKTSLLIAAGRTKEARTIAEKLIQAEPRNIQALATLAAIEESDGRNREHKALLERILTIDPNHTQTLITLGNIALDAQSFSQAASYFNRVLANVPEQSEALLGRATIYRRQGRYTDARKLLTQIIERYPDWADPYIERAAAYRSEGSNNRALEDLAVAKKLEPQDYWVAIDMGTILSTLNRKEEALNEFTRGIELAPDVYRAYVYRAGILEDLKRSDLAERDYGVAARLNPQYYFSFESIGRYRMQAGNWAAARDAFRSAYQYAQTEARYALLAALNWMRAGKMADPKQFLEQALRQTKRDTPEWYLLNLYHNLSGDLDVSTRADKEQDPQAQSKFYYYLGHYYDIRNNTRLANRYFLLVHDLNQTTLLEWHLNEWIITERKLKS